MPSCTHANTLRLGTIRGNGRTLALPPDGRMTHLYLCGGTGAGKSKLLEYLVRQDIKAWPASHCGLLLLDPHGSVYHNLVDWLAANGVAALKRPVVLVDLAQDHSIVAYNVLRPRDRASRSVVIDALVEAIAHVWGAANTTATPLFARWASNLPTKPRTRRARPIPATTTSSASTNTTWLGGSLRLPITLVTWTGTYTICSGARRN